MSRRFRFDLNSVAIVLLGRGHGTIAVVNSNLADMIERLAELRERACSFGEGYERIARIIAEAEGSVRDTKEAVDATHKRVEKSMGWPLDDSARPGSSTVL